MRKIAEFLLFLIINFGALAIGGILTGASPVENNWYQGLNQAPWTPPGFVFGLAWTVIMLCFSIYLTASSTFVLAEKKRRNIYLIHVSLNVLWNPVFFFLHWTWLAFPILIALILTLILLNREMGYSISTRKTWLLFPYYVWLVIAASLNAYIALMN